MSIISNIFHVYIYAPILGALVFIYENMAFHDLGVAIIILTIFTRIVLFPIFYKSAKDQTLMQKIQPKMKEIQEKLKGNKEAQAQALMALYKENKLNPFSGFFLLLIQLPIFIALFQIFSRELSNVAFDSSTFFGLINLSERSILLAVIAAGLQYIQGKMALSASSGTEKGNPAASIGKTMVVVGPALTLVILFSLPSALGMYWVVSTIFSIGQQVYINKKIREKPEEKK
jgi:YidC/Oxa1 family membrane protein insertase